MNLAILIDGWKKTLGGSGKVLNEQLLDRGAVRFVVELKLRFVSIPRCTALPVGSDFCLSSKRMFCPAVCGRL